MCCKYPPFSGRISWLFSEREIWHRVRSVSSLSIPVSQLQVSSCLSAKDPEAQRLRKAGGVLGTKLWPQSLVTDNHHSIGSQGHGGSGQGLLHHCGHCLPRVLLWSPWTEWSGMEAALNALGSGAYCFHIPSWLPWYWASFFVLGGCRASRLCFHGLSNVSLGLHITLGTGTLDVVLIQNPFIFSQQYLSGMECKGSFFSWWGSWLECLEFLQPSWYQTENEAHTKSRERKRTGSLLTFLNHLFNWPRGSLQGIFMI